MVGVAVKVTDVPVQIAPVGVAAMLTLTGSAKLIVTSAVAIAAAQPPEAATVLVTVYVPGVEAEALMMPVASMLRPVVEVNVPAVAPAANVAVWLPVALVQ